MLFSIFFVKIITYTKQIASILKKIRIFSIFSFSKWAKGNTVKNTSSMQNVRKRKSQYKKFETYILINIGQKQPTGTYCFILVAAKEITITVLGELSHENRNIAVVIHN